MADAMLHARRDGPILSSWWPQAPADTSKDKRGQLHQQAMPQRPSAQQEVRSSNAPVLPRLGVEYEDLMF